MARTRAQRTATVGVAEHGNSAVLVTVASGGDVLDRRCIDLTHGLPTHPYHHEGSWAVGRYVNSPWARAISLADAVALVERVRESAARGARETFAALAAAVPVPVAGVAIRVCPRLPPTTGERIADVRHDQCALRGLTIRPGGRAGNSARRPTRASMASATAALRARRPTLRRPKKERRRAPNWRRLRHRVNRRRACCSSHTSTATHPGASRSGAWTIASAR